jgi:hypothetical protein
MNVSNLMHFLKSGKYKRLLTLEKQMEILKSRIRQYQELVGERRIEWLEHSVVGKFVNFRKYDHDEVGLKEFLDERGLLPVTSNLRWKELTEEEQRILEPKNAFGRHILKFVPNRENWASKDELEEYKLRTREQRVINLVGEWKEKKKEYTVLSKTWSWICLNSSQILASRDRFIDFGTVSLKQSEPIIDVKQAFIKLGRERFKSVCKPDEELTIEQGLQGYYSLKEVRNYRRMNGIQSRYYLMNMNEETRMRNMLENKLRRYSIIAQQIK